MAVVSGSVCTALGQAAGESVEDIQHMGVLLLWIFSFPFLAKAMLYVPRVSFTLGGLEN